MLSLPSSATPSQTSTQSSDITLSGSITLEITEHSSVSSLRPTGSGAMKLQWKTMRSRSSRGSTSSSTMKPRRILPWKIPPETISGSSKRAVKRKLPSGRGSESSLLQSLRRHTREWALSSTTTTESHSILQGYLPWSTCSGTRDFLQSPKARRSLCSKMRACPRASY